MAAPIAAVLDRFLAAQLGGQQKAALGVIEQALAQGHTVRALQRDVVQAAQREVGRLWQENRLGVAHEHMATAIAQRALVLLYVRAPPPARLRGSMIVVACVDGELHDFPARMVADYLEIGGYPVRYLGASVPTGSLCEAIAASRPAAVALSVTMVLHVPALRAAVAAVRERFPGLPILAGGQAFEWLPKLGAQLGITVLSGDSSEALLTGVAGALEGAT